jgi:hypothetical protein
MENQIEIWKDIIGYEGLYQISNLGKVKSLARKVLVLRGDIVINKIVNERILKESKDGDGYLFIHLSKEGISRAIKTHRLVCMTFLPNPENKKTVNHINGIKTDNTVQNLEWATHSENSLHAFLNGLIKPAKGKLSKCSKPIAQFTKDGIWVRDYDCLSQVKDFGYNIGNIGSVCRGKVPFAHGFKWSFRLS